MLLNQATSPRCLQSYLQMAEASGQVKRIGVQVDPVLELSTIVDQARSTGHAGNVLLFEQVQGCAMSVAANLFGTPRLVDLALGIESRSDVAARLYDDLMAAGAGDSDAALRKLCSKVEHKPVVSASAEGREVITSSQGLALLPGIISWPGDSGIAMTMVQVVTRSPESPVQNSGLYRVRILDAHRALLACRGGSGMAAHLRAWADRGEPAPVALVLGGPPILTWASSAPLPEGVDEMAFCGYLSGAPLPVICCETHGLRVPATAEVIIEGEVAPGAVAEMGRFGNHTGSYAEGGAVPMMTVRKITTRKHPICPWTLVGAPPRENIQLAKISAALLLPLLTLKVPTVRALDLPDETIFHGGAVVNVSGQEGRSLPELADALRSSMLLRDSKLLVIGADDHRPEDLRGVLWRVMNRAEWQHDVLIKGHMMTVDARRVPPGGPVSAAPAIAELVQKRWREYGLE